jgi:hypothetical protein
MTRRALAWIFLALAIAWVGAIAALIWIGEGMPL